MDFKEELKNYVKRIENTKDTLQTEEATKMDKDPFLTVNLLNLKDAQISQLSKFQKSNFSISDILDSASLLKYVNIFKDYIDR